MVLVTGFCLSKSNLYYLAIITLLSRINNLSNLAADNYSIEFWSITDIGDSDSGASPNYKSTFSSLIITPL